MKSKEAMNRTRYYQEFRGPYNGCWEWTGPTVSSGHGQTRFEGVHGLVHRMVWEAFNGKIKPGVVIRHACDNPLCFRIGHLVEGSQKDNVRDSMERGRHYTKLTDNEVIEIQEILEVRGYNNGSTRLQPSNGKIGKQYGVTKEVIRRIEKGIRTTHN